MYCNDWVGRITRRFDFDPEAGTISNDIDFVDFREPDDLPSPRLLAREPRELVMNGNVWIVVLGQGVRVVPQAR